MEKTDNKTGLARREFLKTTGALVVGFTVSSELSAAQQGGTPAARWVRGVSSGPPDNSELDSYIAIHPNNTATIYSGYVDIGQGGPTALCQIAAEELDLDFSQVLTVRADTFVSTNGFTAASRTAGIGGTELRAAAAEARRALLTLAAERLKVPGSELTGVKGGGSVKGNPQRSGT